MVTFDDFSKIDIRVGTIVRAEPNSKAKKPAFILDIDFGQELGRKKSSAQITDRYSAESLIGTQIVAVVNFPVKRVAGVKSEVLVLGLNSPSGIVLVQPQYHVENGEKLH